LGTETSSEVAEQVVVARVIISTVASNILSNTNRVDARNFSIFRVDALIIFSARISNIFGDVMDNTFVVFTHVNNIINEWLCTVRILATNLVFSGLLFASISGIITERVEVAIWKRNDCSEVLAVAIRSESLALSVCEGWVTE